MKTHFIFLFQDEMCKVKYADSRSRTSAVIFLPREWFCLQTNLIHGRVQRPEIAVKFAEDFRPLGQTEPKAKNIPVLFSLLNIFFLMFQLVIGSSFMLL